MKHKFMNYLQLNTNQSLTEFRMELEKGKALLDSMVGTLYRDIVASDLNEGWTIFNTMLAERKNTLEYNAYITFNCHHIFQRIYSDAYDHITKFN